MSRRSRFSDDFKAKVAVEELQRVHVRVYYRDTDSVETYPLCCTICYTICCTKSEEI